MNTTPSPSPEAAPAQKLWVELTTRITTQSLHYRSGAEETAAESVHSLFKTVRELLEKHPQARVFQVVSLTMLNKVLRPYTARWHGWMTADRRESQPGEKPALNFRDEQARRMFRAELQELQARLGPYLKMLERLAQADASIPSTGAGAEKPVTGVAAPLPGPSHEPPGVRPSSGAAGSEMAGVLEIPFPLESSAVAAPGDGRPPVHGPDARPRLEVETTHEPERKVDAASFSPREERVGGEPERGATQPAQNLLSPALSSLPRREEREQPPASGSEVPGAKPAPGDSLPARSSPGEGDAAGAPAPSATVPGTLAEELKKAIETTLGPELATQLHSDQAAEDLKANLGAELDAGVGGQVQIADGSPMADLNRFEHWRISRRRDMWAGKAVPEAAEPPANQPAVKDAIGLALSGGGIRSATFCLGIVQVLERKGLLPEFDYVSTVSGGGYLGSFLSCALGTRQPGDTSSTMYDLSVAKIKDVFHRQERKSREQGVESALVRHLRNNSKYLLSGGVLGRLRIVGLLLSGVVWNVMIMLPIPLFAALLVYLVGPWCWGAAAEACGPVLPALTGSPAGWLLVGLAGLLAVTWLALPLIELLTHGADPKKKPAVFRGVWENLTLLIGVATVAAGLFFLTPALFHGHEWLRTTLKGFSMGGLNLKEVAGLVPASASAAVVAGLVAIMGWLSPRWPRLGALVVKLLILSGPVLFLCVFLLVGNRMGLVRDDRLVWNPVGVGIVTLALAVWSWLCVNINTLGPHRYYRNRLCDCYLARRVTEEEGAKHKFARRISGETVQGSVEVLKQVKLSSLGADLTAPYHLINMTVNVPGSDNKNLRGRGGDFFIASRHFWGSPITGYAPTDKLEAADPHFDLGTAMAVSAAAASTNMGWQTLPNARFLMTLFNVRLGYWVCHPSRATRPAWLEGAGPLYLFREMLGRLDEKRPFVNLSDGGHIENLAAYELLRRKCKFILCVDAGHEPGMGCADLIRLQRYAEIDLRIRMYFDPADLQIGANGFSRAHAILVKIDYAPDPTTREASGRISDQLGWMLYVKLAMTGVEPAYVKEYRERHPEFPHQTTGDQIYEEDQFEAYRALGEWAMDGLFRDELTGPTKPTKVRDWFQCLANNLLPDNDPAFAKRA